MPKSPDDLAALKAERAAADREYNDALTRLDRAIQQLPADFPQPPPVPDEHQVTPLNTLWKIDVPQPPAGWGGPVVPAIRRMVAPLFEQQQAFNAALVDHVNRNVPVARETRASIDSTLTVLRDTIAELIRFQSLLVDVPAADHAVRRHPRSRRGGAAARLSGAINAVADERMKRSETLLARDARRKQHDRTAAERVAALHERLSALDASTTELRRQLARPDAS